MAKLSPEQEAQWYRTQEAQASRNAATANLGTISPWGVNRDTGAAGNFTRQANMFGAHADGMSPAGGGAPQDPLSELLGNARGRVSDLTNDPVDAMIRQRLQSVMSGNVGPYDDTTKNALFTSQADQAGAGEAARNQSLMDQIAMNGGSMNDPSAHAAMNENMLQRQLANQGAHLNVDMNANVGNFNAAQQATGMLGSQNNTHQAQITQASQYLGNQLGQVTHQTPSVMPNFQQFSSSFTPGVSAPQSASFTYNPGANNSNGGLANTLPSPNNPAPVYGGSQSVYNSSPANYSDRGPWAGGYNQTQNPTTQHSQTTTNQNAADDYASQFRSQWEPQPLASQAQLPQSMTRRRLPGIPQDEYRNG